MVILVKRPIFLTFLMQFTPGGAPEKQKINIKGLELFPKSISLHF